MTSAASAKRIHGQNQGQNQKPFFATLRAMISFKEISLRRGARLLFEQVDLSIYQGESIGLVGDNGSGKTSLFSMILGEIANDSGELSVPANLLISHVAQQTPNSSQRAIDYVLDGDREYRQLEQQLTEIDPQRELKKAARLFTRMEQINGYSAAARAAKLLSGLGFGNARQNDPTASFSGGWRVRLNLAQALMAPSDLLLLDEPTNHLDLDTVIWLEDWLKGYQGTLLLISHDREFIDAICKRILHIDGTGIRSYRGNYSRFEHTRAEILTTEKAAYDKQQRQVTHMENYIRKFRAKATKARQAQSRIKALERMQMITPAHANSPFTFAFFETPPVSDPIIKLDRICAGYQQQNILHNLSLSISSNDRIGLLGPNGAGKSTLVKVLAGELKLTGGHRLQARNLKIGYFAQHQLEQLDPEKTPLAQLQTDQPAARTQDLRNYLGGFGFTGDRVNQPIGPFSGGEKARLALAILIYRRPNLLLLDEPTNHLDIEMRHALSMAMQDFTGAIVLVSHDRHLINTVTDRLILVNRGRAEEFNDDMAGYLRWTRKRLKELPEVQNDCDSYLPTTTQTVSTNKKQRRQYQAQQRAQLKPLAERINRIEKEMTALQSTINQLEQTLSDPATFETESTATLAEMMKQKSRQEKYLVRKESDWLRASEELEQVNVELRGRNT